MTSTIVDWLPLFVLPSCCDILAQSLDSYRQKKGLRLYAWAVMDMIGEGRHPAFEPGAAWLGSLAGALAVFLGA